MLFLFLVSSLTLTATGQDAEDEWIDPYDMLNYEPSTKSMRNPVKPEKYPDVPTKRREHAHDPSQAELCHRQLEVLQKQVEEQKKKLRLIPQQPTCTPVFKRFLSRLLKAIERVGSPSDSADVLYDAKIKLSKQSMTEIQTLLEGEESWRTGALDNAISQILVDLRPHNYEAWKWHFEDTFGVELDTLIKIGLFVLLIFAIICTQLWSKVSWFVQFRRLFAVCFVVSIIWNWFYMYKIAFAQHQKNMVNLDDISGKCTGVKKIEWSDSLKEWFRSTLTLQDDPCKKYYEGLFVNPLLLVPPTKAISVTIVTFVTEPLKHIGEGISDFIRALLKDLPITLQIPVMVTVMLIFVVFTYVSLHAAFQHGIMAPFRRPQRDPPPPQLLQQQRDLQAVEDYDHLAGGDSEPPPKHPAARGRLHGNQVHQRRANRPREEAAKLVVETLRTAERPGSEDELDAQPQEAGQTLSADPDSEEQQETQEELTGVSGITNKAQSKAKPAQSDLFQSETKPPQKVRENLSKHELGRESKSPAEEQPSQTASQDPEASAEDRMSSDSMIHVETIGVPVQESSPLSGIETGDHQC